MGLISWTLAASLFSADGTALGGPCTAEIEHLRRQVAEAGPVPLSEPTAAQSTDAQLHHQPTPDSVGQAKHTSNKDADAALERAKNADAANDAANCNAALAEARSLYEIKE